MMAAAVIATVIGCMLASAGRRGGVFLAIAGIASALADAVMSGAIS